jgi:hypothetical protein
VGNNPVNFNDPTGHRECEDERGCGRASEKLKKTPPSKPLPPKCRDCGPDGFQIQLTLSAGMDTNLVNMRGENVDPMIFYGISIVFDKHGGLQIYGLTRDIKFNPYYTPGAAEKAYPMNYTGAGITLAVGTIGGTEFAKEGTNAYAARSVDFGASAGPLAIDHWELFDETTGKTDMTKGYGNDIGYSLGAPVSGGSFAMFAHAITPRLGPPIQDLYSE